MKLRLPRVVSPIFAMAVAVATVATLTSTPTQANPLIRRLLIERMGSEAAASFLRANPEIERRMATLLVPPRSAGGPLQYLEREISSGAATARRNHQTSSLFEWSQLPAHELDARLQSMSLEELAQFANSVQSAAGELNSFQRPWNIRDELISWGVSPEGLPNVFESGQFFEPARALKSRVLTALETRVATGPERLRALSELGFLDDRGLPQAMGQSFNIGFSPSLLIDRVLGIRSHFVEEALSAGFAASTGRPARLNGGFGSLHGNELEYIGLSAAYLQTPYRTWTEVLRILRPPVDAHVVDLGAGYGRLGVVTELQFPHLRFTGFEIVPERFNEAQQAFTNLGFHRSRMVLQNLAATDFRVPSADIYVMYDPASDETLRKILGDLRRVRESGKRFRIVAIEGRGDFLRRMRQETWLRDTGEIGTRAETACEFYGLCGNRGHRDPIHVFESR